MVELKRLAWISVCVIISFLSTISHASEMIVNSDKLINATAEVYTGSISGTVVEAGTGESLIGANILIKGTLTGTATDVDGSFILRGVEVGPVVLVVSYLGFKAKEVEVNVVEGETTKIDIEMEWEGVTGEQVVITAQARGQVAAINQQLQSNTIANVVSKDRIQDIPDVNAAESIGRLPGVAIQRTGGEADKVVIRGLAPKFSAVTVNGVRLPSSSSDDRSVDLSLISSNILDGIEVKKAITPDMDGDAIAGSVDLKLREAPEGFQSSLQVQGGYTELQDYYENYKITGSISDRLINNKLGYILTVNADEFDRSADWLNAGYATFRNTFTGEEDGLVLQSVDAQERYNLRSRIGGSVLLDYKLNNGKVTFNSFYNRQANDGYTRINNIFDVTPTGRVGNNLAINSGTTEVITSGLNWEQDLGWLRIDAALSRTSSLNKNPENYFAEFRMESSSAALVKDESGVPLWQLDSLGVQPIGVLPFVQPNDSITILGNSSINSLRQEEINYTAQVDFEVPFDLNSNINGYVKFGGKVRWLDRSNDQESRIRNWAYIDLSYNEVTGGAGDGGEFLRCIYEQTGAINGFNVFEEQVVNGETSPFQAIPIYYFNTGYTRNNFLTGEGGDGFPIGYAPGVADMETFLKAADNCQFGAGPGFIEDPSSSRLNDYTGNERFTAAYVMSEINLNKYVTLIPGVRWENDYSKFDTERFNVIFFNNAPQVSQQEDLSVERNFDFILPMVHLQVDPNDWLKIRLAYTETLARPDFTQYIPRASRNVQQNIIRANNTGLRPSEAVNYDISTSVYQNHVGLFTVSGFYKTISDLPFFTQRFLTAQDTLTVSEATDFNIPIEEGNSWVETRPRIDTFDNSEFDTKIWGVEFDWQTNFWYLPSFLKGTVLNINYTRMFSETTFQTTRLSGTECIANCGTPFQSNVDIYSDTTRTGRAFDQPAHLVNVTLGYDYKGFSGRFSYLFQGDRLTGLTDVVVPIEDRYSDSFQRWDITLKQTISENLEFFGNFSNITSTPDRNLIGDGEGDPSRGFGSPTFVQYYGFTMDLGVRLTF